MKRYYKGRAKTWGLGESGTGKEQVGIEFEILNEDAPENERLLSWYGYFTDSAWERTIESLRFCGWQGDDLSNLTGLDANEVQLVVQDEEYDGRVYAKIAFVNRLGGQLLKAPMAEDKAKAFAAQMKARIGTMAPAGSKRPAQPKRQDPPPPTDADNLDIPF